MREKFSSGTLNPKQTNKHIGFHFMTSVLLLQTTAETHDYIL